MNAHIIGAEILRMTNVMEMDIKLQPEAVPLTPSTHY
jgi:hypothetical protein